MKETHHHQSTDSNGSTYPLPSLCSSISSYNSSSKSLPLTKNPTIVICGDNADVSRQPNNNNNNNNERRQRWDDSQFAIELCDDSYKSVRSSKSSSKSSGSSSHTIKTLTKKISKLFNNHQHQYTQPHSSHSDTSSNNSHQISVKFTSLLRKIKSMKSL